MKGRIFYSIISFIFIATIIFSCFSLIVSANSIVPEDIDKTDVVTDLQKMEAYNSARYGVNETVDYCEIIDLIEYGYDYEGSTTDYGLYLYIYNPSCADLVCGNPIFNKVQLRVAKVDEEIAGGDTPWRKYSMTFLSKSSNNLFYKFRIDVPKSFMLEVNKDRRVYEIADVELLFSGETTPRSVGTSGKWIYSGYQEYHGPGRSNKTSSITWDSTNLLTVELDINPASWKTNTSSKGEGYQHELSSVYFSVPDKIIEDYGNPDDVYEGLREVDGYYDNCKITGISTTDNDFYETVDLYRDLNCTVYDFPFAFATDFRDDEPLFEGEFMFAFNIENFPLQWWQRPSTYYKTKLLSYGNAFKGTTEGISGDSLRQQVRALYNSKTLTPYVGSYGRNFYFNIKADDSEAGDIANQFTSYAQENGENWLFYLFSGNPIFKDEVYDNIEPIVVVDEGYVANFKENGADYSVENKYYICAEDTSDFCDYVLNNASDYTTYLMRFAVTDYYCSDIYVAQEGSSNDMDYGSGNYYFEKEVFLNFDILSLTWENKNGVRTVIPVQATPVDVVGNATPTPDKTGGLPGFIKDLVDAGEDTYGCAKALTGLKPIVLIVLVILVFAVISLIPGLGNFLAKCITLPFKLIGKGFKAFGKSVKKRKKSKKKKDTNSSDKKDEKKE